MPTTNKFSDKQCFRFQKVEDYFADFTYWDRVVKCNYERRVIMNDEKLSSLTENRTVYDSDVNSNDTVSMGNNSISYKYREIHESGSNRGIHLTIKSTRGALNIRPSAKQYHISPQIHNDSYYKKNTADCYKIVAHAAMTEVLKQDQWPRSIIVKNRNFDQKYELEQY